MAAEDPISAAQFAPGSSSDYMDLFSNAGAWEQVSSHVSVFKLYAAFVAGATDAQLQQVIDWSNRSGVQLALETGVLPVTTPDQPGWGVEGYDGAVVSQVQRLKDLGGNLSYIAMDEPLYFGQQWSGTNAAHSSTATLASQAAATIAQLQQIYPNLQVGDIEPIPQTTGIAEWINDLQADTGQKLAFFDADVSWDTSYQASLASLAATLHADGITYGVIINGEGSDTSNTAWTDQAIANFVQIESDPALTPDQLVFQTWNPYPTQMLGEDTPGTFTNVMLQAIDDLSGTGASAATSQSASASVSASTTVTTGAAGVAQLPGSSTSYEIAPASVGGPLQIAAVGSSAAPVTVSAPVIDLADGVLIADPTGTVGDVARLYDAAFGTAPDLAGLQYWTSDIENSSVSPVAVAQSFVSSPEMQALYGSSSDSDFVGQLYENVLGRAGDQGGDAYWVNLLQSGTSRGQVLYDFAESSEEKADTIAMSGDPDSAEATRLYQAAFDRAPDTSDLAYWASSLQSGATPAQIAGDFVSSAEFGSDFAGLSGATYVTQLYENVLGRAPDAGGLAYWSNALQQGASTAGVLQGFADSAENLMRTASTTHAGYVLLPAS